MEIDELAIRNSSWVWRKLTEARVQNYQIGEESLTDFVLLNFKKWGTGKIEVISMTCEKESKNGADWEWWLTGPSGHWLGVRVQAKVLKLTTDNYEHLHYRNKNKQYQADLLIAAARTNGTLPVYCMYTNWKCAPSSPLGKCLTHDASDRHYGISMLSPFVVQNLRARNTRDLNTIAPHLKPMHCLFCCSGYGEGDLPNRALNWLSRSGFYEDTQHRDSSKSFGTSEFLRERPPGYVLQLFESRNPNTDLELPDDRPSGRVTVFKELPG